MIIFYYRYFVEQAGCSTPALMVRQGGAVVIKSTPHPGPANKQMQANRLPIDSHVLKLNVFRVK
jgi:hypothetical protein